VDDVEAAALERRNEAWEEPVVTDVDVAPEAMHADAVDRLVRRHLAARRALVTSVRREDVDLVAPRGELLRDALADDLDPADDGRVVRHELSNLQAV
jgi:hypothetical protein